jgi:hypothetical protein
MDRSTGYRLELLDSGETVRQSWLNGAELEQQLTRWGLDAEMIKAAGDGLALTGSISYRVQGEGQLLMISVDGAAAPVAAGWDA